ncbi:hypothetical protein B0H12DRAFT_1077779 [Mycena haematopus]|nr:hypothetical protein B0H12DRAFT_1077779 [Mycena haematopus]
MVLLYERMSGRGQGNRDVREIDEAACNETRWTMGTGCELRGMVVESAPPASSFSNNSSLGAVEFVHFAPIAVDLEMRCWVGDSMRSHAVCGASRTRSDTVVDWRAGVLGGTRRAPKNGLDLPALDMRERGQEPPTLALTAVADSIAPTIEPRQEHSKWSDAACRVKNDPSEYIGPRRHACGISANSRVERFRNARTNGCLAENCEVTARVLKEPPTLALTAVVTHCGNVVWRTSVGRLRCAQDRTLSRAQQVVRPGSACSIPADSVAHKIEPCQEHSKWSDAGLLKNDPYYFGSDSRPKTNGTKTLKLGRDQSQCKSEAKCENVYHVFQRMSEDKS